MQSLDIGKSLRCGAGLALALTFSAAHADGVLEEVIVTAQKRAENVQDVPIAVSAFTAEALQERAIGEVSQIANITPNVSLDAGTPFSASSSVLAAYIRGIGANDFAFNIDPGVGIYLDGVYLARSVGANQDLSDVDHIEVLKGPQGTLFGRNTIGGAVSIITHEPGKEFKATAEVTGGSYHLLGIKGQVDIPFSDSLRSSIAFSNKRRDGYMKRIPFPGFAGMTEDPITSFKAAGYDTSTTEGGDNMWSARVKLLWDNGGLLKATFVGDYTNVDQSATPNSLITTVGGGFKDFYNCAISGNPSSPPPCAIPPVLAYLFARGGTNSPFDLAPIFGANVDTNPYNNRLPYDDRFVTGNPDTTYATGASYNKLVTEGLAATLDFRLTDNIELKSISAYRQLDWNAGQDLDGSPLNFLHVSFPMFQHQLSQEFQLLGSAWDKKLNYVGGLYYFRESGNLHDYVTFAEGLLQVDGPNDLWTKNYAAFGQLDFRPTDLLGFTIGGRYTKEKKEFEGFQTDNNAFSYKILSALGVPPCANINPISDACRIAAGFPNPGEPLRYYPAGINHKEFSNFSPKFGVQLHPGDDMMLYASYSVGYKTGGWTTRLSNPLPNAPDFDEEKAKTIELGFKSQLLNHSLQINAAVFSTQYDGIQLNFQQGVSPTIQNAGNARIKGAELEIQALLMDGLSVTASAGYLSAYYSNVLPGAQVAPSVYQAGVYPDAELPKTPKWKTNVSPRYEIPVGNGAKVVLLADWTYTTRMWNDTERSYLLERKASNLFNANVSYRSADHWNVVLGGTNLSDKRFLTTGQAQLAGGQVYGNYNRPREWYLTLRTKY